MTNRHVAIVGYAFRLPGTTTETFWEDLWNQKSFLHPRPSEPGCAYTFAAGSLGDVSRFDADFFGISPREAAQMDPQQRLLLEFTWEAFEHAGIRPSAMRGSACGVYLGLSSIDYAYRRLDDLASIDASTMTGNTASIAANRISYWFDLKGPSVAVDTACSSALVAFHLACQAIATGECTHAVTGGIGLHLHPFGFIGFSKASMLSRRGRCHVFDASGDGYVRAEGGGVFLLKNLQDALTDGDPIRAVVAATGTNCDGRTNGITVPSAEMQSSLLTEVYGRAGISPNDIDYLEAHGTGTAVGDPIEAEAIARALARHRPASSPLLVGSVKSNLGHLEAASGVAGLVKVLHCLGHRSVPPSIHLDRPNPRIPFEESNLKVVTDPTPLAAEDKLVMGVNSFGFGGANAHVVLESGTFDQRLAIDRDSAPVPLLLSGRNEAALRDSARDYARLLQRSTAVEYPDIAYSAALHRDWHPQRLIAFGADTGSIIRSLTAYADGEPVDQISSGVALADASRPAFVYSGNGSQWSNMGRTLLQHDDIFHAAVQTVDDLFSRYGDYSILSELLSNESGERMSLTEVAQPTLFAIQVGLTSLLQHRGLVPAAVVGHSVGEVAAAWACGALTMEQAVQVVAVRSKAQGTTRGHGGMTAVGLNGPDALALLEGLGINGLLNVAGFNSPRGVTVAGDLAALATLEAVLTEREVFFRRLGFDYAFHSPAMDAIAPHVQSMLSDLQPHKARTPFYSTVTGCQTPGSRLNAAYWWQNIREPVRFDGAIDALITRGINVFVEVGPHAVLRNYISDCLRQRSIRGCVIPTMQRGDDRPERIQHAFFQVLIAGSPYDAHRLFPFKGRRVDLPRYPWQRERHWHSGSPGSRSLITRRIDHPLLGYRLGLDEMRWENQLDTTAYPDLADHAVGDATVLPAAGFIEMSLAAAAKALRGPVQEIEEMEILAPLLLNAERSKTVQFALDMEDGSFTVRSRDRLSEQPWLLNARGRLLSITHATVSPPSNGPPARNPDLPAEVLYRLTTAVGLHYGRAFQTVTAVWIDGAEAWAQFKSSSPTDAGVQLLELDPMRLDGCFQLLVSLLKDDPQARTRTAYVPIKVQRLILHQPRAAAMSAHARLRGRTPRSVLADFALFDPSGQRIATLDGVRFRAVPSSEGHATQRIHRLQFRSVPLQHHAEPPSTALPASDIWVAQLQMRLHTEARLDRRTIYYREVEPLLDVLCASYAERCLRRLTGSHPAFSVGDLIKNGLVAARHESLLLRVVQILQEDGLVEPTDDGWRWTADSGLPPPEAIWISLIGDYPDYSAQLIPVGRAGHHLADTLSGPAESDGLPTPFHRDLFHLDPTAHADLARSIDTVIASFAGLLPESQRLQILEWTSVDSRTSRPPFAGIDRARCDLWRASPNDALSELGNERGEGKHRIRTFCLDLDQPDPRTLTRMQHTFDLIVVPEGMARLRDAENALHQLHALLKPGGRLVLIAEHPSRSADLVFGSDASWWTRQHRSPFQTPRQWRAMLDHLGWESAWTMPDVPGIDAGPFIVIADAPKAAEHLVPRLEPGLWVVLQDHDGYGAATAASLGKELEDSGHRVIPVRPADHFLRHDDGSYSLDPERSVQWEELFHAIRDSHGEIGYFVHLYALPPATLAGQSTLKRQSSRCQSLVQMLRACETTDLLPSCWVVTQTAAVHLLPEAERRRLLRSADIGDATVWGFGRTLMNEYPEINLRLVDLAEPHQLERMCSGLLRELLSPDSEDEIILTGSGRYAARLEQVPDPLRDPADARTLPQPDLRLDFSQPGQLKSLGWHEYEHRVPARDEIAIAVRAAGLNFRDVMYAMGLLSDEAIDGGFAGPGLGMELSGVVTDVGSAVAELQPGDEIIAFAPWSLSNRAVTKAAAAIRKPEKWSFEAAATVPIAYFTVYYALHHLARLREGETVLVHGAAGGVGIAAIQLAKALGAEIFATAGSTEKRDFLQILGADHVLDSRTLAFADEILEITAGRGIDVVLNSLAGEAINRNLRVLKPFGRFLELGKRDFYENTKIGLRPFRNNIAYFGIDADQLMIERPELTRQLFLELMDMFEQGTLKPLPYRVFDASEAVDAFRYMQQSRHIGKIVLRFDEPLHDWIPRPQPKGQLSLNSDASYLVTGGLSGFGLEAARWLAQRGAGQVHLVSREGRVPPESATAIQTIVAGGTTVRTHACDVSDRRALSDLLEEIERTGPPLRGIVHAAAVYEDSLTRTMTLQQLERVLAPKVAGTLNLFERTCDLPLDFLVLLSSVTTLFGNPGQAAYVAGNHFLEALAEQQRAAGRPAFCVGFGPIGDAGYLARHPTIRQSLETRLGGAALSTIEALEQLEQALLQSQSGVGLLRFQWAALNRILASAQAPKFEPLALTADRQRDPGGEGDDIQRLLRELNDDELAPLLLDMLKKEVAGILQISPDRLDDSRSIQDLGMDSLMGMELITAVEGRFGVKLPILSLSEGPTLLKLVDRIIRQLRTAAGSPIAGEDTVAQLTAQYAAELTPERAAKLREDIGNQTQQKADNAGGRR